MAELVKGWDAPVITASADAAGHLFTGTYHCNATLAACLRSFIHMREWHAGDVAVTCDVYHGSSHPTEFTAGTPVFRNGRIEGWKLARTDVPDVGGWELGAYSPRALDIWSEGGRIVPARAFLKGRPRREVLEMLQLNTRTPRLNGAIVTALCRYLLESAFSSSKGTTAQVISEQEGESVLEAPGVEPLRLKIRVRRAGERIAVSFPGLPAPSTAPLNATRAITLDAVCGALRVSPALVDLDLPDDTLLTATQRRPVGWGRAVIGEAIHRGLGADYALSDRDPHLDRRTGRLKAERVKFIEACERGL